MLSRIARKMNGLVRPRTMHTRNIMSVAEQHDMYRDTDECFFAGLYLSSIRTALRSFPDKKRRILDAGCGQGRLAIPLAKEGYRVDAVDMTPAAVERGRCYAAGEGVTVNFTVEEIRGFLRKTADRVYDAVLCIEMLYMIPEHQSVLADLVRILKEGGILAVSVRPRLYYVLYHMMRKDLIQVETALVSSSSRDHGFFSWWESTSLREKLTSLGLCDVQLAGLGVATGIDGDPQACFARPSDFEADEQRAKLLQLESALGTRYPDCGRYILAVGRKGK